MNPLINCLSPKEAEKLRVMALQRTRMGPKYLSVSVLGHCLISRVRTSTDLRNRHQAGTRNMKELKKMRGVGEVPHLNLLPEEHTKN